MTQTMDVALLPEFVRFLETGEGVIHYCTGPWDEATRARRAREAPMLRPDA